MDEEDHDARWGGLAEDAALLRLWPDIEERELVRWNLLSRVRRKKVLRRLEALARWEGIGEDLGIEDVLRTAGVNLSTMYAMRQRWAADRSLRSLGVYVRTAASDGGKGEKPAGLARPHVLELLSGDPDLPPARIAQELASRGVQLPKTSLLRLIRSVRGALPITAPFGRMLVFDNAGVDVVDMWDRRQRLYVVLDEDTGLVAGWTFRPEDDVVRGYSAAAEHALQIAATFQFPELKDPGGLSDLDLGGVEIYGDRHVARFVGPPSGDPLRDVAWRAILEGRVHDPRYEIGEEDRSPLLARTLPGSRLVKAVGDRVGPVWVGTGLRAAGIGYRTSRPTQPMLLTHELGVQVGRALHERNLHVLSRLERLADGSGQEAELDAIRGMLATAAAGYPA